MYAPQPLVEISGLGYFYNVSTTQILVLEIDSFALRLGSSILKSDPCHLHVLTLKTTQIVLNYTKFLESGSSTLSFTIFIKSSDVGLQLLIDEDGLEIYKNSSTVKQINWATMISSGLHKVVKANLDHESG